MPEIACIRCGKAHLITHQGYIYGDSRHPNGVIRGVLTCQANTESGSRSQPCEGVTLFELTRNVNTWTPGTLFHEDLSVRISPIVRDLFQEAVNAFYGGAYKGVVALCRSAVEQSLDEKGVVGNNLFAKITKAPENILGSRQKTWADASRLDGRDALHRLMAVTPTQALTGLNITIQLLNHIANASAVPVAQSE